MVDASALTMRIEVKGLGRFATFAALAIRWCVLSDEIAAVTDARAIAHCTRTSPEHLFPDEPIPRTHYDFDDAAATPCWKQTYSVLGYDAFGEPRERISRHRFPMCGECARFVDISDHRAALVRQRAAVQGAMRRLGRKAYAHA